MNNFTLVTIIMPIRNEAAYIEHSLGAVLAQDYPSDRLQVLVVDGRSTDNTREVVQRIINQRSKVNSQNSPSITLLDNPQQIVPTALNIGLAHAKGDVIMRVDGHCEIPPDYVTRCAALLHQEGVECVGGPIETIGETPTAQTIAVAMSSSFGVGGSAFRTVKDRTLLVDTLAFGAYSREAIERCGLFDEELVRNQDEEYNYRLRKLGGRILLTGDIRSRYYSRGTLRKLWRQYYQYGFWKVRVLQKHPRQMQPRQFVPPAFVATLLGSALFAPLSPLIRRLWTFLLILYLTANFVASSLTAAKRGWRHLALLPVVFAILHISYGLGFLVGLIRFADRWEE